MEHAEHVAVYEQEQLERNGVECEYCRTRYLPRSKRGPKPKHRFCKEACRVRLAENDRLRPRQRPHVSIKVPFAERRRIWDEARKGWKE